MIRIAEGHKTYWALMALGYNALWIAFLFTGQFGGSIMFGIAWIFTLFLVHVAEDCENREQAVKNETRHD